MPESASAQLNAPNPGPASTLLRLPYGNASTKAQRWPGGRTSDQHGGQPGVRDDGFFELALRRWVTAEPAKREASGQVLPDPANACQRGHARRWLAFGTQERWCAAQNGCRPLQWALQGAFGRSPCSRTAGSLSVVRWQEVVRNVSEHTRGFLPAPCRKRQAPIAIGGCCWSLHLTARPSASRSVRTVYTGMDRRPMRAPRFCLDGRRPVYTPLLPGGVPLRSRRWRRRPSWLKKAKGAADTSLGRSVDHRSAAEGGRRDPGPRGLDGPASHGCEVRAASYLLWRRLTSRDMGLGLHPCSSRASASPHPPD
ncbi:hypothetical protein C8Q77DRAFT_652014 [Trametes polyzona]|nr:hypothetical protein C8Q77DRAFT_652014 [Trametes polyzona]